jgi:hypothetical protein
VALAAGGNDVDEAAGDAYLALDGVALPLEEGDEQPLDVSLDEDGRGLLWGNFDRRSGGATGSGAVSDLGRAPQVPQRRQPTPWTPRFATSQATASSRVSKKTFGRLRFDRVTYEQRAVWRTLPVLACEAVLLKSL